MARIPRRIRAAILAVLLCPGGLPAQSSPQQPETFSESLVVREREILVDLPDNIDGGRLSAGDFRVLVDGVPREVTRAEPASGEWTIVLYVDQVLARPGTVFYSTLALASHARELTRLGSVEVVAAGSDPRTILPPTREVKPLQQALTDLSAAARVERDRLAEKAAAPSIPAARRQLDKLLAFLASRRPAGPHAVFLVADGPDLTPEQTALLERKDDPAAAPATVFHRASRLLAAYGWTTLPVPLRKEGIGGEITPQSEIEILRQGSAPSSHQNGVPPVLPNHAPRPTTLAWTGVIDLAVEPRTAALRVLSRATAGAVLGFEQQIDPMLAALSRRWRLWVTEPDGPVDGRLHSVDVSLPDQIRIDVLAYPVAVNRPSVRKKARSQEWIRSSTPEEIAEARLEALLSNPGETGDLPLTAEARRTPSGMELRIEVAPLEIPESAPPGPVRVSWAFSGEEGAIGVHHQAFPAGDLEKGFRQTVRIDPPAGARRMAVVVEALGPDRWAGRVLEIGP